MCCPLRRKIKAPPTYTHHRELTRHLRTHFGHLNLHSDDTGHGTILLRNMTTSIQIPFICSPKTSSWTINLQLNRKKLPLSAVLYTDAFFKLHEERKSISNSSNFSTVYVAVCQTIVRIVVSHECLFQIANYEGCFVSFAHKLFCK